MHCHHDDCYEAFCEHGCLKEHENMVRNIVYHIMRDRQVVDDITQEVFLKAYQSIASFRGGSFRAYLGRIARNQCYDMLRRKKSHFGVGHVELVPDEVPAWDTSPEQVAVSRAMADEVKQILDGMQQVDREIILLRHVHQFSYGEIAAIVGLRVGAIRTRISRARQKIVDEMERREMRGAPELG